MNEQDKEQLINGDHRKEMMEIFHKERINLRDILRPMFSMDEIPDTDDVHVLQLFVLVKIYREIRDERVSGRR